MSSARPAAQASVSIERAKASVRTYYEEVLNGRSPKRVADLFSESFVMHSAGSSDVAGRAAFQQWIQAYLDAVPDYRIRLDQVFGERDLVAVRWTCEGTHAGRLFGLAATGRRFTLTGVSIFRMAGERMAEAWIERDAKGLFEQLTGPPATSTPVR